MSSYQHCLEAFGMPYSRTLNIRRQIQYSLKTGLHNPTFDVCVAVNGLVFFFIYAIKHII